MKAFVFLFYIALPFLILYAAKKFTDTENLKSPLEFQQVQIVQENSLSGNVVYILMGKCECAVFNLKAYPKDDKAIIIQNLIEVTCNNAGKEKCQKLCTVLSDIMEEHGSKLLCASVRDYNKLQITIRSRICKSKTWTLIGFPLQPKICCRKHYVIDCKYFS